MVDQSVPVQWVCFVESEVTPQPHTVSVLTSPESPPPSRLSDRVFWLAAATLVEPHCWYDAVRSLRHGFGGGRCGGAAPAQGRAEGPTAHRQEKRSERSLCSPQARSRIVCGWDVEDFLGRQNRARRNDPIIWDAPPKPATLDQCIGYCYSYIYSALRNVGTSGPVIFISFWAIPINRTATEAGAGGKPPVSEQECQPLIISV